MVSFNALFYNFPSKFEGTHEEKLQQTRIVRDKIKEAVQNFIKEHKGK